LNEECPLKFACTKTDLVVKVIYKDKPATWASELKENFELAVFFGDSLSGIAKVVSSFIKQAVPKNALTSFLVLGSGILLITATRPGSIPSRPPPTIKPRYIRDLKQIFDLYIPIDHLAAFRTSVTRGRYFRCV